MNQMLRGFRTRSPQARQALTRADAARDRRAWGDAAAGYRDFLAEEPKNAGIWVQLGHAIKENGDLSGAEQAYATAIRLDPTSADGHLQMGHLQKMLGRHEDMLMSYQFAALLDPTSAHARQEVQAARQHMRASLLQELRAELAHGVAEASAALPHDSARLEQALGDPGARRAIAAELARLGALLG